MKHFFHCLLVAVILLSVVSIDIVSADELIIESAENENAPSSIIDSYIQALTDTHWKVSADTGRGGSCLGDIYDYWPEIHLPQDDITLYKNALGQIYISFVKTKETWVAEIIFAQDMKSFMLYSANCAIIYKAVEE